MSYQPKPHILVVDDDDRLRRLLEKFLSEQHYLVTTVESAARARSLLENFRFDVAVLDVMMPGETGLQLLETLPEKTRPPILMLSAMGEVDDRIKGLEVGADDYLPKPFEPKELLLRIHAILRRYQKEEPQHGVLVFGDYRFDSSAGRLEKGGAVIALTSAESGMLALLAAQPGQPLARELLAGALPGTVNERSVDVHMSRLRKKIEDNDGRPHFVQTVRGKGYVLYAKPEGSGA